MKIKYALFILLGIVVQSLHSQITFRGCTSVMGAQDFILNATGTNTDAGVVRNIYESTPLNFGQSCPAGVCEMRIIWNTIMDRWEMQLDNDGPLNAPDYTTTNLYVSLIPSHPNPPDVSTGNWQSGGFCPGGITTMSGTVDDGSTLSVEQFEIQKETTTIFPNPTTKILNIKTKAELSHVIIYSILGKQLLDTKASTLNVSTLKEGIYLITIKDVKGNVITKRFIKQ